MARQHLSMPLFDPQPPSVSLPAWIVSASKTDLHRHFLGSVTPESAFEVARTCGIPLSVDSLPELRRLLSISEPVRGLREFFKPWAVLSKLLFSPESVTALLYRVLRDAASDNVTYVELRASWGMTGAERFSVEAFLTAAQRAIVNAESDFGIIGRLDLGITRHIFGNHEGRHRRELWNRLLRAACKFRGAVVVGFDLSGIELNHPPFEFRQELDEARAEGFPITIHCGETTDADTIWQATELKASRVGHALSAVNDPMLLKCLADNRIVVEVCPSVNWLTGTVPDLRCHPASRFIEAGIPISVATDNPAICGVTLSHEIALLAECAGLNDDQIRALIAGKDSGRFFVFPTRTHVAGFGQGGK